jgi:hypothetical protein
MLCGPHCEDQNDAEEKVTQHCDGGPKWAPELSPYWLVLGHT